MYFSNTQYPIDTILLASAVDNLAFLAWTKTKDAEKGKNRPKSIINELLNQKEKKEEIISFDSGEAFDIAWARLTRGI